MNLKLLFTLLSCCSLYLSYAQNGEAVLEVVGRKMNLYVIDEEKGAKSKYSFSFANDTMTQIKLPKDMWKKDTLVELDLVTQEEKMVFGVDSMLRVHINLGAVSKDEINAAISDGFSIAHHCNCKMVEVKLIAMAKQSSFIPVEYFAKTDYVMLAKQSIDALPANATLLVKKVGFSCPDNQGGEDYYTFEDMAVMKIKE